jgi:heptosyltransferase-2
MGTKRILIFDVNWLGDVLFSTACIRNIRYNFPDSFIACIVPSRCVPVLEDNPYLNEIIIYDDRGTHRSFFARLSFIASLRRKRFNMVFLLHKALNRALIAWAAGIPERIGYDTKGRGFLLTKRYPPPQETTMHRADYYLGVLQRYGLIIKDRFADFPLRQQDSEALERFLKSREVQRDRLSIGINPGGNWNPKRWQKEYFAELCDRLIHEYGAQVLITGGKGDLKLAQEIQRLMHEQAVLCCGALSLKEFGALCARLDVFITADSGPLHIANACGARNIIALFGPTDPALTGPYPAKNVIFLRKDVGCKVPCYIVDCHDNRCMKAITPDDVIEKIKGLSLWQKK